MASVFARLTVKAHDRPARAGWYEILADGPQFVLARRVNDEGEDYASHYNQAGTLVEVQELISADAIVRRRPARLNLHYGTLEVVE